MFARTVEQILMKATHDPTGREAFLLFAILEPEGVTTHSLQAHCALINAFAHDPRTIQDVDLGATVVLEGPGAWDNLAAERLGETLGNEWSVQKFAQKVRDENPGDDDGGGMGSA